MPTKHSSIVHVDDVRKMFAARGGEPRLPLYAIIVISSGGRLWNGVGHKYNAARGTHHGHDADSVAFSFVVPPSSIDLNEPSASEVVPTQDGGIYVETQGQLIKDLSIEGTTGFRPEDRIKIEGGKGLFKYKELLTSVEGQAAKIADAANRIGGSIYGDGNLKAKGGVPDPPKWGETGIEAHARLKNVFRTYWEAKADITRAAGTLMIWGNLKEQEVFVIEPTRFRSSRSAASPYLIRYEIEAKTLFSVFDALEGIATEDYLKKLVPTPTRDGLSTFITATNDLSRGLSNGIGAVSKFLDGVAGQSEEAVRSVLRVVSSTADALTGVARSGSRLAAVPMNLSRDVRNMVLDVRGTVQAALDTGNAISNLFGGNDLKKLWKEVVKLTYYDLIWSSLASNKSLKGIEQALAVPYSPVNAPTDVIGPKDLPATFTDEPFKPPADSGSGTTLGAKFHGDGAERAVVASSETIYDLSKRLMGARSYAKSLILFNRLRAPYLSRDGDGVSVLRPGDTILYPRQVDPGAAANNMVLGRDRGAQARLGTDIALQDETNDIYTNARGDIGRVTGNNNVLQAVRIKFMTEQGELPIHPWFGINMAIGERLLGPEALSLFIFNARMTLLSDPRIGESSSMDVVSEGDMVRIVGNIRVVDNDKTLFFDYSAGRGLRG